MKAAGGLFFRGELGPGRGEAPASGDAVGGLACADTKPAPCHPLADGPAVTGAALLLPYGNFLGFPSLFGAEA